MTRRILLVLERSPGTTLDLDFAQLLSGTAAMGEIADDDLEEAVPEQDFSPGNIEDARRRVLAAIALRQGQPRFRRELMKAYGGRCAVTGCDLSEALEAAHILAYRGAETNHVQNGILLRGDLHTLFDRGLIGVDPRSWTIVVHARLLNTHYGSLSGTAIVRPVNPTCCPSAEALLEHLRAAGLDSQLARPTL
jgi:hypothetical protein